MVWEGGSFTWPHLENLIINFYPEIRGKLIISLDKQGHLKRPPSQTHMKILYNHPVVHWIWKLQYNLKRLVDYKFRKVLRNKIIADCIVWWNWWHVIGSMNGRKVVHVLQPVELKVLNKIGQFSAKKNAYLMPKSAKIHFSYLFNGFWIIGNLSVFNTV